MRVAFLTLLVYIIFHLPVGAQMKVGNNPSAINNASLLELESTNKGFVLPHVLLTSVTSLSPLATAALNGTMIYNVNNSLNGSNGRGVYYWDSVITRWIPVTPFSVPGTTNYVAKWTNAYTVGSSTVLYDNGTDIGINTISPVNSLDVSGSQAIGSYAGNTAAPANSLIVSGNVGIGTSAPANALSVISSNNPVYFSGVKATTTPTTDSILTINAGIVKKMYSSILTYNVIKAASTLNNTVSFPVIGTLTTVPGTITFNGAATGNSVVINPRSVLSMGISISYAYVSAANTITVYFLPSTLGLNSVPAGTVFDITLLQ